MRFVRFVLLGVLCVLCALLVACGGDDDGVQRDATLTAETEAIGDRSLPALTAGREFTSPDGRYSLRVPADWVKEERAVADMAFHSTEPGLAVRFSVASEQNGAGRTLQGYAQAARQSVEETFENVLTVSFTPVRVGGVDAMRWMYTATVSNVNRLYYQVYVVEPERAYVLTGIVSAEVDFELARETFDPVAGSFKLGRG